MTSFGKLGISMSLNMLGSAGSFAAFASSGSPVALAIGILATYMALLLGVALFLEVERP